MPRDFADWREIPSETLERNEVRRKLAEALAELGQIYREVFVLRDMQHLSIEETAKALGISTASVKTRLLRARLMLRDLLAPGLGGSWSSKQHFDKATKPWSSAAKTCGERFRTISKVKSMQAYALLWKSISVAASTAQLCSTERAMWLSSTATKGCSKCPWGSATVCTGGWKRI